MSTQPLRNLGLSAVPVGLKPLVPFLQRADELKAQEPIIAYWCSYHAAQLGITAKVKDAVSRNFLLSLLVFLETLKQEIGPSDAIDNDAASAAYVENFALRIFGMADNEDRSGKATKGTAKKFLAAVNFLELLKVFDNTEISESIDDKIRYAKWKAADIAKAFREGRNPTPGPANQPEPEPQFLETTVSPETSMEIPPPAAVLAHLNGSGWPVEVQTYSHEGLSAGTPQSPGNWDIASTPESTTFPGRQDGVESRTLAGEWDPRRASVSDELEGVEEDMRDPGSPKTGVSEPPSFGGKPILPSAPPFELSPMSMPSSEPIVPNLSPPGIEPRPSPYAHNLTPPPPPPPVPETEPDLTPQQIAKAQKHCKFAISALDYEDFKQAKKDLREALRILGG